MAYPTKYTRQYGFQGYQDANPSRPLPGDKVDADYNAVALSSDEVVEFLKLHTRSDGLLKNGVVSMDSLGADVLSAIALGDAEALASAVAVTPAGGITATNVQDALEELDAALAGAGAVSSVFGRTGAVTATAGDYTATQVTNTPAGNIAATTVQAALNELDTEKQPLDADLTALAALAATAGMLSRTGAGAFSVRTLTAPAAGITISNGDGAVGNPTLALANDLSALEALASTGLAARTGTDTWAQRTITGPAAGITVTNGNGVSGNPTLALANDLSAVEGLAANGLAARTATDTWAVRTITAPAAGITVSNGDGVSGNPTLALANDLAALEGLSSTGLIARTADGAASARTITGTANQITVTNGDGVSGNPTLSLALTYREQLTADRTYYVRTDGSDSNNGLANTSGGAFLTMQKAIDVVYGLDFGVYNVTISVQSGTYTGGASFSGRHTGTGSLTLAGTSATISRTGATCITASNGAQVTVSGFTLTTTTSGSCLSISGGAAVSLGTSMTFGACASDHIGVSDYGRFTGNSYTISGGATRHIIITGGSVSFGATTTTVTGTPAFSGAFLLAQNLGVASFFTTTFSGAATGSRYSVSLNSAVNVFGAGASYFPGNSAGSTSTGGQYG